MRTLNCHRCNKEIKATGARSKYCVTCRDIIDEERRDHYRLVPYDKPCPGYTDEWGRRHDCTAVIRIEGRSNRNRCQRCAAFHRVCADLRKAWGGRTSPTTSARCIICRRRFRTLGFDARNRRKRCTSCAAQAYIDRVDRRRNEECPAPPPKPKERQYTVSDLQHATGSQFERMFKDIRDDQAVYVGTR